MRLDIGISLIVLQKDIIFRLVFFDEIVFERQGVYFRTRDDIVKVRDMLHHRRDLLGLLRAVEVLPHPIFENARLSDINHHAVLIQHNIYARIVGQKFEFLL